MHACTHLYAYKGILTRIQCEQAQTSELALLRQQAAADEEAAMRNKREVQALAAELEAARRLQEDLLAAADEERAAREKATGELHAALEHTARMQALGDAAIEETGTVSEQVKACGLSLSPSHSRSDSPSAPSHTHHWPGRCLRCRKTCSRRTTCSNRKTRCCRRCSASVSSF